MNLPLYLMTHDPGMEGTFIVRTAPPRFIAELVEPDGVDPGLIFEDGEGMSIRQWIDMRPADDVIQAMLPEIFEYLDYSAHTRGV